MFDLGKNISDLLRKILSRTTVDAESVEALIKGLQRILLQADVDVKLVFELSQNIRRRCLKEKIPPGLTLREQVMKVVYDELVKLLGEKQASLLGKKQIMLVGLFGSGKCIHEKSLVPLSTGEITTIKDLYENLAKQNNEMEDPDGFRVDVKNSNIEVYSFDPRDMKIKKAKVKTAWKLRTRPKLIEVTLDNGNYHHIIVTPEHPFFVLDNNCVKEVPAISLTNGTQIAIPRILLTKNTKTIDLRREFLNRADDDWLILDRTFTSKARVELIKKFKTLKVAYNKLMLDISYAYFTRILKHGKFFPISLCKKIRDMGINILLSEDCKVKIREERTAYKPMNLPLELNAPFAEFLGYVYGDGHVSQGYVEFTNEDFKLILKFNQLLNAIFGVEGRISTDKRRKDLNKIQIASKSIVKYLQTLFKLPTGAKSKKIDLPDLLLKSPDFVLKFFLRAYFDCDSYVGKNNRSIELTTASKVLSKKLQMVLSRFGIASTLSKRIVKGEEYFRIMINAKYAEIFAKNILSYSDKNIKKLLKFEKIGQRQGAGKQDIIEIGSLLRETRESLGLTIGQIQRHISSYGNYERNGRISRQSLRKFIEIIESEISEKLNWLHVLQEVREINDYHELKQKLNVNWRWLNSILGRLKQQEFIDRSVNPHLEYRITELGLKKIEEIKSINPLENLKFLKKLANSDVCWVKVKNVKELKPKSKFVYDLTVEGFHNFVANNVIVHNTTTAGKLARHFQKQGLKPALICSDYHRPAAPEQLMQLANKIHVPVHISKERDPYKALKEGLGKFKKYDTIIIDTAGRNALDEELAKELKKMYEISKPDEVLLVIPADIGKIAGKQAEEFNKLIGITGIIVTKMDGTAKGGGALSACSTTKAKVKFIGNGEKLEDLEAYDPVRFVSRLLGMGDLQSLLEKAKEVEFKEEDAKRILSGKFTLQDFYDQISGMQKMGPLSSITNLIPGLSYSIPEEFLEIQEEKLKKWKFIIQSMTPEERKKPEIIHSSRIKRIARGSGTSQKDVRDLLKHYEKTKKLLKKLGGMKGLKRGKLLQLAKKLKLKL